MRNSGCMAVLILFVIFCAVSYFAVTGTVEFVDDFKIYQSNKSVKAMVVDVYSVSSHTGQRGSHSKNYYADVEYSVKGRLYSQKKIGADYKTNIGDPITMYYYPDSPDIARSSVPTTFSMIAGGIFNLILYAFAIFCIVVVILSLNKTNGVSDREMRRLINIAKERQNNSLGSPNAVNNNRAYSDSVNSSDSNSNDSGFAPWEL